MAELMQIVLPKLLGAVSFEVHAHRGKPDLLGRLPDRLRGYAKWIPDGWRIIVVVDRDDQECSCLKHALEQAAASAGLSTRTSANGARWVVANRLAIEELEAWYFGDWIAVRGAYPRVSATIPKQTRYRDPDAIPGGTWEAFEQVLQRAGYFRGGLAKVEAARTIAAHMNPGRNSSHSFGVFRDLLLEMVEP